MADTTGNKVHSFKIVKGDGSVVDTNVKMLVDDTNVKLTSDSAIGSLGELLNNLYILNADEAAKIANS